jgi:glycosyltransferase involved in cell wall biosynthesis
LGISPALVSVSPQPAIPEDLDYPVIEWNAGASLDSLSTPFNRPDVVVFHSTYIPQYIKLAAAATALGVPYIITPRGGLTGVALKQKYWKKHLANLTVFRSYFSKAAGYHFLTPGEAEESKRLGKPYFVTGNGVDLPEPNLCSKPGVSNGLRFTFIGRIASHVKGLDILLAAISLVAGKLRCEGVHVNLYGSQPGDDSADVLRDIRNRRVDDLVSLHPRISAVNREFILQQSDIFIIPSRTEGHPVAALEALACGLPCIASPSSRIGEEVEGHGAGWMTDGTPGGLAACMVNAASKKSNLAEMGKSARTLVDHYYSWPVIAERTISGYRELIARSK